MRKNKIFQYLKELILSIKTERELIDLCLVKANEREVIAVLKLLSHTARNFPGVFFHGRAAATLPVIGRLLPFLADPSFWYGTCKVFFWLILSMQN